MFRNTDWRYDYWKILHGRIPTKQASVGIHGAGIQYPVSLSKCNNRLPIFPSTFIRARLYHLVKSWCNVGTFCNDSAAFRHGIAKWPARYIFLGLKFGSWVIFPRLVILQKLYKLHRFQKFFKLHRFKKYINQRLRPFDHTTFRHVIGIFNNFSNRWRDAISIRSKIWKRT